MCELINGAIFIDGDEVGECLCGGGCLSDEPGESGDEEHEPDDVAAGDSEIVAGDVEGALPFFITHQDDG